MLAAATRQLALGGAQVLCVARSRARLDALEAWAQARSAHLSGVAADYRSLDALCQQLAPWAPFDLGVFWIHSAAPQAPERLARLIQGRLIHVLGSASASPTSDLEGSRAPFEALEGLRTYQQVVLGFVPGPQGARWLTHQEISQGVLDALASPKPLSIVGQVTPWSQRP